MAINDPDNPLYGKEWRGGKKPVRYYYTTEDIAKLTGRAIGTVRNDMSAGRLEIESLSSVIKYVNERGNNGKA